MSDFLSEKRLGRAIAQVMAGRDVRCAVAFWGDGAAADLLASSAQRRKARIVCDLSMGGTNPKELRALGAPSNDRLKHLTRLHAKVYMSSEGVVVCSANASNNGVGFVGAEAGLIEAGTGYESGSPEARQAEAWFEQIWNRASQVDDDALIAADEAWKAKSHAGRAAARPSQHPGSLLHALATGGEQGRGIGVVFTSENATLADLKATVVEAEKETTLTKEERRELRNWKVGDLFHGWSVPEVSAWPRHFVCAHKHKRGKIAYYFYERVHVVVLSDGRGDVLARRSSAFRKSIGLSQSAEVLSSTDADLLSKIFATLDGDGLLCENGDKVAELLDQIG